MHQVSVWHIAGQRRLTGVYVMQSIEEVVIEHRVQLLIIDSIAVFVRAESGQGNSADRQVILGEQLCVAGEAARTTNIAGKHFERLQAACSASLEQLLPCELAAPAVKSAMQSWMIRDCMQLSKQASSSAWQTDVRFLS